MGHSPVGPVAAEHVTNNDVPEWQGYDATPQDQREFPDLAPIRPREARVRDGRAPGEWQGQQGQAPQQGGYGYPDPSAEDGYRGAASRRQAATAAASTAADTRLRTPSRSRRGPGRHHSSRSRPGPGRRPGAELQAPSGPQQQAPQQQAPQQARSRQPQQADRKRQDPQDEDVPSWAEPDSVEAFSARWHRRGLDSRDERRGGPPQAAAAAVRGRRRGRRADRGDCLPAERWPGCRQSRLRRLRDPVPPRRDPAGTQPVHGGTCPRRSASTCRASSSRPRRR